MDNFTDNFNSGQNKTGKVRSFFSVPKIIFIVLGLIILIEIIYAVKVLTSPSEITEPQTSTEVISSPGKISLSAPKSAFLVNEVIPLYVDIDSGSRMLDGADVIIKFDPKVLEATSGALQKGEIFDEYPLLSADMKNGLISVSGVNSKSGGFKGAGQFLIVNFKAKAKGETSLTVDFAKDVTSDSNLVEAATSKDILESVDNLSLQIQ